MESLTVESLTAGMGESPMPGGGGLTMELGKHSAPIGVLDPFKENVSPMERASSADWTGDRSTDGDEPNGDRGESEMQTGRVNEEMGEASGAEGITRLSNTTYGKPDEKPYEC